MSDKPLALIIEDDVDLSTIFAEALHAAGFQTEVIRDGGDAARQLNQAQPSVVVLDLHLPHISGLDLMVQIRGDERLAETRVIITTADPRMAEMLNDQADLVLIKPISFVQLRDLASRLLPSSG
jgi:DNA-binding response OmpR family regulator